MLLYLIAHTDTNECNIAQATIPGKDWEQASELFGHMYPARVVAAVGIKGEPDPPFMVEAEA